MDTTTLLRLAGLAAVASGVFSVAGDLGTLFVDVESAEAASAASYLLVFALYLVGALLMLLGLVGLYAIQAEKAGAFGLTAFLVAFIGTALVVGALWFELFITPPLATDAPELAEGELGLAGFIISFLFAIIGWILFGSATHRAGIFPRWAAWLLIAGALVSFFPIPLAGAVLSIAVAWLGFDLFTGKAHQRRMRQAGTTLN